MRVAINGVGIAGPTLAYWLQKLGHEVLLIEESPELRRGGYTIDFWGVGYDIAERMGLLPRIGELGFQMNEVRYVDRRGRRNGGFPVDIFRRLTAGRFIEIARSDLAAIIYEALEGKVETIFSDSVAAIEDTGDSVRVSFDHAAPRTVDLVVGADGLHSRVRELAFGPAADFEVQLGYYVAAFEVEGYRPRDKLVFVTHAIAGRQVSRLSSPHDRTLFLFVFRHEYLSAGSSVQNKGSKELLRTVFADVGWECPQILAAMEDVEDVYFDRVSQIRMEHWTKGRTALIGDAAACVSLLGGEGTGLAIIEAYVLAGELSEFPSNHTQAFTNYESRLRTFLRQKQESAAKFASSFLPESSLGVTFRNQVSRLLRIPFMARLLIGRAVRDDFEIPDYPTLKKAE